MFATRCLSISQIWDLPIGDNHIFICWEPSVSLAGDMLSLHLNELNNSAIVILSATTYWDELSIASESSFFLWIIGFLMYLAKNITSYVTLFAGAAKIWAIDQFCMPLPSGLLFWTVRMYPGRSDGWYKCDNHQKIFSAHCSFLYSYVTPWL